MKTPRPPSSAPRGLAASASVAATAARPSAPRSPRGPSATSATHARADKVASAFSASASVPEPAKGGVSFKASPAAIAAAKIAATQHRQDTSKLERRAQERCERAIGIYRNAAGDPIASPHITKTTSAASTEKAEFRVPTKRTDQALADARRSAGLAGHVSVFSSARDSGPCRSPRHAMSSSSSRPGTPRGRSGAPAPQQGIDDRQDGSRPGSGRSTPRRSATPRGMSTASTPARDHVAKKAKCHSTAAEPAKSAAIHRASTVSYSPHRPGWCRAHGAGADAASTGLQQSTAAVIAQDQAAPNRGVSAEKKAATVGGRDGAANQQRLFAHSTAARIAAHQDQTDFLTHRSTFRPQSPRTHTPTTKESSNEIAAQSARLTHNKSIDDEATTFVQQSSVERRNEPSVDEKSGRDFGSGGSVCRAGFTAAAAESASNSRPQSAVPRPPSAPAARSATSGAATGVSERQSNPLAPSYDWDGGALASADDERRSAKVNLSKGKHLSVFAKSARAVAVGPVPALGVERPQGKHYGSFTPRGQLSGTGCRHGDRDHDAPFAQEQNLQHLDGQLDRQQRDGDDANNGANPGGPAVKSSRRGVGSARRPMSARVRSREEAPPLFIAPAPGVVVPSAAPSAAAAAKTDSVSAAASAAVLTRAQQREATSTSAAAVSSSTRKVSDRSATVGLAVEGVAVEGQRLSDVQPPCADMNLNTADITGLAPWQRRQMQPPRETRAMTDAAAVDELKSTKELHNDAVRRGAYERAPTLPVEGAQVQRVAEEAAPGSRVAAYEDRRDAAAVTIALDVPSQSADVEPHRRMIRAAPDNCKSRAESSRWWPNAHKGGVDGGARTGGGYFVVSPRKEIVANSPRKLRKQIADQRPSPSDENHPLQASKATDAKMRFAKGSSGVPASPRASVAIALQEDLESGDQHDGMMSSPREADDGGRGNMDDAAISLPRSKKYQRPWSATVRRSTTTTGFADAFSPTTTGRSVAFSSSGTRQSPVRDVVENAAVTGCYLVDSDDENDRKPKKSLTTFHRESHGGRQSLSSAGGLLPATMSMTVTPAPPPPPGHRPRPGAEAFRIWDSSDRRSAECNGGRNSTTSGVFFAASSDVDAVTSAPQKTTFTQSSVRGRGMTPARKSELENGTLRTEGLVGTAGPALVAPQWWGDGHSSSTSGLGSAPRTTLPQRPHSAPKSRAISGSQFTTFLANTSPQSASNAAETTPASGQGEANGFTAAESPAAEAAVVNAQQRRVPAPPPPSTATAARKGSALWRTTDGGCGVPSPKRCMVGDPDI